jgi:TonB-linked SusC/RagA family outer membrane protein
MKENCSVSKNSPVARLTIFVLSMLLAMPGIASAQLSPVSGTVQQADGTPIEAVTVVVDGTRNANITDREGRFTIPARVGDVLTFNYFGMLEQKITVEGAGPIAVTMQPDVASIEEVIVIGYGQALKGSVTGSISQVRGAELLKAPMTNVSSMLSAHIPGMTSLQTSGQPGADFATLKVRGSTYSAKFIVDGIERDNINYLDPSEIETISVLKDAASTAVFGLGAMGGVVMVTTKQGIHGRPKIDYRGTYGVSMNTSFPEFLDGPGYAYWYNKALEMDGATPIFSKTHVDMMTNGDDSDGWGNTDWFEKIFGMGSNQQHSLSMNGGTETTKYFASLGYFNQKGNIDNFDYNRYNARVNIDTKVAKNLTFAMGISGQVADRRSPGFAAGGTQDTSIRAEDAPWLSIAEQAAFSHPYIPAYYVAPANATDLQKTYNGLPTATRNQYGNPVNPVTAASLSGKNHSVNYNVQSNTSLKWDVPWVKGLSAKLTGSYDAYLNTSRSVSTPYFMMLAAAPGVTTTDITYGRQLDARGSGDISITESFGRTQQLTSQSSIEYKNTFGKHRVEGLALFETQDKWGSSLYAGGVGMVFPEIAQLNQADGSANRVGGLHGARARKAGVVFRGVYEYDERYVLELSGRYDGSYKFIGNIPGLRWAFAPSASFAWRMSNENFIRDNAPWINNLKLRVSFGESVDDRIVSEFSYMTRFSSRSGPQVIFGGQPGTTFYSSVVANPMLTWDRERKFNTGVEATLWGGLLGFEVDYFYHYHYDILTQTSSSAFSPSMGGYYRTYINDDEVGTHGFDLKLTHDNRLGDFSYGASLIVTYSYAKWLKYNGDTPETPEWQKRVGHRTNMYMGFQAAGLFQSEDEIDSSPHIAGRRPRVGDIKYVDIDGDGAIVHGKDNGFFGRPSMPPWAGSISLRGGWKNIDVNVVFTGGMGHDVRMTGQYYNWVEDSSIFTKPFKAGSNAPRYLVEGAWRPDNTNAKFPRLSVNTPNSNNDYASTFWFHDGKYLRMKSFQLGYTIPPRAVEKLGIASIRIFVEGSNLFTWSGLPEAMDPEWPAIAAGYYPQQRTFMGGVAVTF